MKNQNSGFTITELLIALLVIFGAIGWVMNIIEIVGSFSDPITGAFIFRCIGVIVLPLGAILGWIPF